LEEGLVNGNKEQRTENRENIDRNILRVIDCKWIPATDNDF
jgi:hypothetical protein